MWPIRTESRFKTSVAENVSFFLSWTLASGADLAAGVPGLLGTGDQNLTAYSLRIPTSDALGAGGETVTSAAQTWRCGRRDAGNGRPPV
jgi:hypothetical protein